MALRRSWLVVFRYVEMAVSMSIYELISMKHKCQYQSIIVKFAVTILMRLLSPLMKSTQVRIGGRHSHF